MKFLGELDEVSLLRTQRCNVRLRDPARLQTIRDTGLLDTPPEKAFDRLARLAAQLLEVPLTIFSLVVDDRQFFKADYGLASPFKETRTLPIDASLCRYTLEAEPIISSNAPADPFLRLHPSTGPWGIVALIVLPLVHPSGHVLGTFCCIQPTAREWTERDMTVMRELTESVMTEILLREQIIKLKAEQKVRETFVAALTHDMRTPLMNAKMSMELLRRGPGGAEGIELAASRVTRNIDRAERMIRDLLDASRIEARLGVEVLPDVCDLGAITAHTLQELSAVYPERFRLQAEGDFTLVADRDALQRVIENLASNAAKYGAPGTTIEVVLERAERGLTLRVTNQGAPIPESQLQSIFEPFKRAETGTLSGVKGWGLGLSLVRGFVEAHGGTVTVTSTAAVGTSFTVTLPLRPPT
jgi:signal transduction histidine kinase